jgi:hypothetical protein
MAGSNAPPRPVSADAQTSSAAPPPSSQPASKKKKEGIPAYMQQPFMKQITRSQAINGKLLEDNTMVRVLREASSNDIVYDPKQTAHSHYRNIGAVRRFGDIIGRVQENKTGARAAASGSFPSNWRPTAPPNDAMTRPASASSGVAFNRQITRKQDVNGKLLENIAMTRFLFGSAGAGPEVYENAHDTMMGPLHVSHRPRVGSGQHVFAKQIGRPPLNRTGTRAAADGTFPSHWEPGMGYSETIPKSRQVADFMKQNGRTELHLSGMRGAPPKAALAADYQGPTRPQSAMAALRGGTDPAAANRRRAPVDTGRPIPEGPRKHIEVHAFSRQLTREQWGNRPLR